MSSTFCSCFHRHVAPQRQYNGSHGRNAFALYSPTRPYGCTWNIQSTAYNSDQYQNNGRMGMVLAGFLVAEMPIIRMALDEAGGNAIEMLVCSSDLLYKPVQQVFEKESEPDWSSPIPPEWVDGGGWGRERVVLFQNIPYVLDHACSRDQYARLIELYCTLCRQLNQLEIVQVLYDVGIPPIIHSMSLDMVDDTSQILGEVLGKAVQVWRRDVGDDEEPYMDFGEEDEASEDEEDAYMVSDDCTPDMQPLDFGVIDDIWENNRDSSY